MDIKAQRVSAAIAAISKADGATALSRRITELTGVRVSVNRVQKWKENGIPSDFVKVVSRICGLTEQEVRPDPFSEMISANAEPLETAA